MSISQWLKPPHIKVHPPEITVPTQKATILGHFNLIPPALVGAGPKIPAVISDKEGQGWSVVSIVCRKGCPCSVASQRQKVKVAADPAMFSHVTAQTKIDFGGNFSKVIQLTDPVSLVEFQPVGKVIPGKPGVLEGGPKTGGTAKPGAGRQGDGPTTEIDGLESGSYGEAIFVVDIYADRG